MVQNNKSSVNKKSPIKIPGLGEAYLLFSSMWKEYRKKRGNKGGDQYTIPDNGYLTIHFPKGYEGKQVRIFVEVNDADVY